MPTSHAAASWPRLVVLLAACVIAAAVLRPLSAEEPANTLSPAERRAGWRLLFDGRTTDGFRNYRQESISPGWKVDDGCLVRSDKGAGDLVTSDEFGSFELQLDYRISPGGNSGLMFHVTEDSEKPWHSGPEVQIIDNAKGKDPQQAGWLYQLHKPRTLNRQRKTDQAAGSTPSDVVDATRPAGEWNRLYLRVSPGGGEVCLNGVKYYNFSVGSQEWNDLVAKSKFAKFPGFGTAEKGHLCLQDHGDEVAFRSIKIRTP